MRRAVVPPHEPRKQAVRVPNILNHVTPQKPLDLLHHGLRFAVAFRIVRPRMHRLDFAGAQGRTPLFCVHFAAVRQHRFERFALLDAAESVQRVDLIRFRICAWHVEPTRGVVHVKSETTPFTVLDAFDSPIRMQKRADFATFIPLRLQLS